MADQAHRNEADSVKATPVYLIKVQGQPGRDGIRSLRWLLKRLLRGLRFTSPTPNDAMS
jgi:hypothetical protein